MQALITAIGLMPISAAFSLEARTTAAAPSLRPDAFPAVTVPSLKMVRSFASFSALVVRFGYSSVSNIIGSPFFCGIITGIISSLKRPLSMAAIAFCWLVSAKLS